MKFTVALVQLSQKEDEGIFFTTFDTDRIREFRKEEKWRLDYRMSFIKNH